MKTQNNYLELQLNFSTNQKKINDQIEDLHIQKRQMTEYLLLKVKQEDWHGVADAAMDIREIVTRLNVLLEVIASYDVTNTSSDGTL